MKKKTTLINRFCRIRPDNNLTSFDKTFLEVTIKACSARKEGKAIKSPDIFNATASILTDTHRKSFLSRLTTGFGRWRLALLFFIIVYASVLLLNLGYMWIQWDEMPHLYGGLLLARGQTQEYLTTYGYYPPLYDITTTAFYKLLGISVFSGRLTAVTFLLLSVWVLFELANRFYGPRTALLSSITLGTMPGLVWVSRVAMLETALVFFFSLSMFFFLTWIKTQKDKALILGCLSLGIGFIAKYQIVVAGIVLAICIPLFYRNRLRAKFAKFLLVPIIAFSMIAPWLLVLYQTSGTAGIGELIYAMQVGGEDRADYSKRFPAPIFYLIEITWPFSDIPVHPVSLPIYITGLFGLGLFAYRRKTEDKILLIWFAVVYAFFTFIPNKQWRYVTPLFPVLAVSAANAVFFAYGKIAETWNREDTNLNKKRFLKIAGISLVLLVISSLSYSSYNAYQMVARDQVHIPIEEATNYATRNMKENESIVVLAAFNLFNRDMVKFYLQASKPRPNQVFQYPELPVDSFTPDFNVTALIELCKEQNVKYLFLYEYGGDTPYFKSNLTAMELYLKLDEAELFANEHRVGKFPRTITIFAFS